MNQIGVMQGRLLPKYKGRYQAHPVGYWEKEFQIASNLNLDCIEFILDHNEYDKNPLMTNSGLEIIKKNIDLHNVKVRSICADIFMEIPFHKNLKSLNHSIEILNILIKNSSLIGAKEIVIPCVDQSSIDNEMEKLEFIKNISRCIDYAEKFDVNISLETDLNPKSFCDLLNEFKSDKIKVNYDTGNSASLGYDIEEEFKLYGSKISDIHIKDRKYLGGSVFLGKGDVNFSKFFKVLNNINYKSFFILQAYRDDEGVDIFKQQLNYFIKQIKKHEYSCNNIS